MSNYDDERNLPEGEQLKKEKLLVEDLYKRRVKDKNGLHVGPVVDIFLDDVHGQPEWITVHSGFMGMKTHFLPVSALEDTNENELIAPWEKEIIQDSPTIKSSNGYLSKEQELELFRYYNIDFVETPDGEEVLDEELVEAEEAGEVNAPGDVLRAEHGEGENLAVAQEHISEERRENLANGDGDNLTDLEKDPRHGEDFDARDPEPLTEDDPENPLRAEEVVSVDSAPVVEDERQNFGEDEERVVEEQSDFHGDTHGAEKREDLHEDGDAPEKATLHEDEFTTITPVPLDDVVITRVEDDSVVHRGDNATEVAEDSHHAHEELHEQLHGEKWEENVDSREEEPYQPRHLKREDGE